MNGVVKDCLDGCESLDDKGCHVVPAVTPVQVTAQPEHCALSDAQEVIILEQAADRQDGESGFQAYEDTDLTRRYRAEMERINVFLEHAALDLDQSVLNENKQANINERRLRRIFTQGQFDSGGRLFGGFWQSLSKQERLEGLRINGDGVACLDYAQMGLRIAYGLQNATPPADDGYRLPGLEGSREAIKKLLNTVLLANKPLAGLPKGIMALLPKGISLHAVMDLLTLVHTQLQPLFFTGIGHRIQYISSQILVDVLLHAREEDMVALPVGHTLIVAEGDVEQAEGLMRQVFVTHAGLPAIVTREAATACCMD